MCLAVPVKVIAIEGDQAKVDLNGLLTKIDISLVPEVEVGNFVIVHVGYALSILDESDAQTVLEYHAIYR